MGRERVSYHAAMARVPGTVPLPEVTEFECPDLPVGWAFLKAVEMPVIQNH